MSRLAQVGDFCPNEVCPDYGKLQSDRQGKIIEFGKTKAGRQRYQCKTCGQTFTETKGTLFYRRSTPDDEHLPQIQIGERWQLAISGNSHKEECSPQVYPVRKNRRKLCQYKKTRRSLVAIWMR